MGKYNIPKQDSKQLVKEIRNSSEGGGAKEYYYKYNHSEELDDTRQFVRNFVVIEVLYSNGEEVISLNKHFTNYGVPESLTTLIDRNCVAIKILDSRVNYITYDSNMPFMVIPKGSIVDKLLYLAKNQDFLKIKLKDILMQ